MSHFILEIGSEELPARFLASVEKELSTRFGDTLKELNISFESMEAHSTPRRSILHIYGLASSQPKSEEVATGPSINIAFDAEGKLSKAGAGFIKGQGASEADIFRVTTDKGEYIAVRKQVGGRSSAEVLAEICPVIISALPFPKRMRWSDGSFAYARPMHWIVALLDKEIIPFKVGEISSSNQTYGHRIHGIGPFTIEHADDLEITLFERSQVMCDTKKRREIIIEEGNKIAASLQDGAQVIWKDSLLDEVQGLVEKAVPIVADFQEDFLEVPREVLLTSMEHHQKCFGIADANNTLLPKFLTVLNVEPTDREVVKKGWERVLRARLEDARFYWKEDLRDGFDVWLKRLDNVIFLGPLGSMGDKSRRIAELCAWLAQQVGLKSADNHDIAELASKTGRYAKADLMSQMVGEFDTLQGIMGGIYAQKANLPQELITAVSEQYLPSGPDSALPSSGLGACLSMADKVDTLVGCFGLGNIPTGTADPYALRRAALGISRILMDFGYTLSLTEIFEKSYSLYSQDIKWKLSKEETLSKLEEFCAARLKNLFVGTGTETLVAEAVIGAKMEAGLVWATSKRLEALKIAMQTSGFLDMAQSLKRITNILAKSSNDLDGKVDESLFEADCEKALNTALSSFSFEFDKLWAENRFDEIMPLMTVLLPLIDAFFEGVMVMAENEAVKRNRMNMLNILMSRMAKLADFSLLQI